VRAIQARGLRIEGLTRGVFKLEATTDAERCADADLVILTTKAFDTPSAAEQLGKLGSSSPVLSLQNGLTNVPLLLGRLPHASVLGGSTTHGVTFLGPGHIRHAGRGQTALGVARGPRSLALDTAALFSRAGLAASVAGDLDRVLWEKAVVNAAINPLTAVLRCANGELMDRSDARLVSQGAAREAAEVARARRVAVSLDPWSSVARVLAATAANRSSMLQDVEAGRRTEIDAITGEIVRLARAHGVNAPVNRGLLALVRAL
jgi:2-dehydropantoate 2-reductase